jgi:hypothetical protein
MKFRHAAAPVCIACLALPQVVESGARAATAAPAATTWTRPFLHAADRTDRVRATDVDSGPSTSVVDPTGDVVNPTTQAPVTGQPEADLVGATGSDDGSTITFTATTAAFADPASSPDWANPATGIDWEMDLSSAGSDNFDVGLTAAGAGIVPSANPDTVVDCPGLTSGEDPATATYTVSFPASCVGSPASFQWQVAIVLDPNRTDTTGTDAFADDAPNAPAAEPTVTAPHSPDLRETEGYWLFAADGGVFTYGTAAFYGSAGNLHLNRPIVGGASTPDGRGYWLVASDGGVFTYGDAHFYGSTGGMRLNQPIVGMAATPDGKGYWLVASDGGVFTFGDAAFHGSTGSLHLNRPIVGAAATPDGRGYWLVAADGGIFTFGDAPFLGSAGNLRLDRPVVGMASTGDGRGYWLAAADGGIFTYGDADYEGQSIDQPAPVVGITTTASGAGFTFTTSTGQVTSLGESGVPFAPAPPAGLRAPIVGVATAR